MLGYHVNNFNEIKMVIENGGSVIQMFLPTNSEDIKNIKKYLIKSSMALAIHSPYTINLAYNWDEQSTQINYLIDEIKESYNVGAKWYVLHTGTKTHDITYDEAYNNIYTSLIYVLNNTKKININILLETSAGEKNEMLSDLNELAEFIKKIRDTRIGICVDTCHIFAAGYPINIDTFSLLTKIFDIVNIKLVHLNDSKKEINSRVDRHADMGAGMIGVNNLLVFNEFCRENNIPCIMEMSVKNIISNFGKFAKN